MLNVGCRCFLIQRQPLVLELGAVQTFIFQQLCTSHWMSALLLLVYCEVSSVSNMAVYVQQSCFRILGFLSCVRLSISLCEHIVVMLTHDWWGVLA